jgi:hypothetical protein
MNDVDAFLKHAGLAPASFKSYRSNIERFSRHLNQPNIKAMLDDYKTMDHYVQTKKKQGTNEDLKLDTLKSYYITIHSVAQHMGVINKEAMDFYLKRQTEYNEKGSVNMSNNEAPDKFGPEGIPPWSDVATLTDEYSGSAKYGTNHMITALYTLIPPRRGEYRTLVYLATPPAETPTTVQPNKRGRFFRDEKGIPYNYVYPKDGSYQMVLRSFKTADEKRNNVYTVLLPKKLGAILAGYIKARKIANDTILFRTTAQATSDGTFNLLKPGSWSKKVTAAIAVKYQKYPLSMRNLRHMYITTHIKGDMTTNEKEAIAYQMAHSLGMQDKYRQHRTRFTADDDNETDDEGGNEPIIEIDDAPDGNMQESQNDNNAPDLDSLYTQLGKAHMEVRRLEKMIEQRLM